MSLLFSYFPFFDSALSFDEGSTPVITIENRKAFRELYVDLLNKKSGLGGQTVISKNLNEISFKNVEIISDYCALTLNNKNFISRLLGESENYLQDEKYNIRINEINSNLQNLFFDVTGEMNYDINLNDTFAFKEIFKSYNPTFGEKDNTDGCEQLFEYMCISRDLLKTELFILPNLKAFFSKEEVDDLYLMFSLNKFDVIIIQSDIFFENDNEKTVVIDRDLCQI